MCGVSKVGGPPIAPLCDRAMGLTPPGLGQDLGSSHPHDAGGNMCGKLKVFKEVRNCGGNSFFVNSTF